MIQVKEKLSDKDRLLVSQIMYDIPDIYGDFYQTKNNIRLFIRDNQHILFDSLKKGDKIVYNENGIAFVTGYSDKAERKYLKVLYKNPEDVDKLLKIISWNLQTTLWIKIKKNNPIKRTLLRNGFRFIAGRGKEILLKREYKEKKYADKDKN